MLLFQTQTDQKMDEKLMVSQIIQNTIVFGNPFEKVTCYYVEMFQNVLLQTLQFEEDSVLDPTFSLKPLLNRC